MHPLKKEKVPVEEVVLEELSEEVQQTRVIDKGKAITKVTKKRVTIERVVTVEEESKNPKARKTVEELTHVKIDVY